jgi:hypothetical protein
MGPYFRGSAILCVARKTKIGPQQSDQYSAAKAHLNKAANQGRESDVESVGPSVGSRMLRVKIDGRTTTTAKNTPRKTRPHSPYTTISTFAAIPSPSAHAALLLAAGGLLPYFVLAEY